MLNVNSYFYKNIMIYFFGNNSLVDDILKKYILEKEDFIYDLDSFELDNKDSKIIISTQMNKFPLPEKIEKVIGKVRTYIFIDMHGEDCQYLELDNTTMFYFNSLSGIVEDLIQRKILPKPGVSICDIHRHFKDINSLLDKPGEKLYHLVTDYMSEYNKEDIKYYGTDCCYKNVILKKSEALIFKDRKKIVNIFIPVYNRFQKVKNSIESIIQGVKNSKYKCQIYIGDNCSREPEIKSYLSGLDSVYVHFFNQNLGKSRAVNQLYISSSVECPWSSRTIFSDYIFSIDSDMIMTPKDVNQIDGMIELLEKGFNIGLVSSFQTGENQHWFGRGVEIKQEREFKIGESKTGIGISGGCICMRTEDWVELGGYEEKYDLYTADDAILMDKVEKKLKKRAVVAIDFPFHHPPSSEDDPGYVQWKRERFQKDGLKFSERKYQKEEFGKGYYD